MCNMWHVGDVKQQALVGQMYAEGYGCKQDNKAAKEWTDRAANRGYKMSGKSLIVARSALSPGQKHVLYHLFGTTHAMLCKRVCHLSIDVPDQNGLIMLAM